MIGREFKSKFEAILYWRNRKASYQVVFNAPGAGARVLLDLADFCHAFKTTEAPGDDGLAKIREGRRQVFLRIQHHLNLSPEQLSVLYRDVINAEE